MVLFSQVTDECLMKAKYILSVHGAWTAGGDKCHCLVETKVAGTKYAAGS